MKYSRLYSISDGRHNTKRLVIGLPTKGCRWWHNSCKCVHCSVASVVTAHPPSDRLLEHVHNELMYYQNHRIDRIDLYTPGSALDQEEIQRDQLILIVNEIKDVLSPRCILFESRPELVEKGYLSEITSVAGEMEVEVCIPLESANADIRKSLGKTFDECLFLRAVETARNAGAMFSSTVLLKPPWLSEAEAIVDARDSLSYLLKLSPVRVVLEPMVVYDETELYDLYVKGRYSPPWLWSIYAAVEYVLERRVEVGGEFLYPEPIAVPVNCHNCSTEIREWIHKLTQNVGAEIELLRAKCDCRNRWLEQMQNVPTKLKGQN